MIEEWRDVPGYKDWLQASNLGKIRSKRRTVVSRREKQPTQTRAGFIYSPCVSTSGYYVINVRDQGRRFKLYVHRLIALAFCKGFEIGKSVDHINAKRLDNRPQNLQWVSLRENTIKEWCDGNLDWYQGETHPNSRISNTGIKEIRNLAARGHRQAYIAKMFGISQGYVSEIVHGKRRVKNP